MPKYDAIPYTQLTLPARGDFYGVIKDVSEALPENKTKYATHEDMHQYGSWASKVRSVTASGTVTIANADPMFVEIDPNGADRDVPFPAKSADNHGFYMRHSGSANTLTLKRSGGATITTLTAGEVKYIMPSTLNDFSAQTGGGAASGGLTNSNASVTTANITGVVKTRHVLDVSGMTANRNFVLPAGTAGDEIEVCLGVGDDTYALILIGNTGITITANGVTTAAATEWSRLFITGESVHFVATSATNWLVTNDGRVRQIGVMERQTAQSIATGADTKIQLATSITNIGNVVDNATNYRITVRRAGTYTITGFVSLAAGLDDQEIINLLIYKNGAFDRYLANYISAAAADKQSYANLCYKKSLAAADYIELYINHNEGAAVNTNTSNYPQLSVIEEF